MLFEYLITQHKCDSMCKDTDGSTPLHDACWNGHLDVAQYLITQHKCDTMCKTNIGSTPLHNAAQKGHLDVVEYLINDTMCKDNQVPHLYTTPLNVTQCVRIIKVLHLYTMLLIMDTLMFLNA